MNSELDGKRSEGQKMLANLLKWLGEPAGDNSKIGGAPTDPDSLAKASWESAPLKKEPSGFPKRKNLQGVIGPLSPRSGGKSSVAEYAAKAKEIGLDFLVVMDDLDQVTPDELAQLKRIFSGRCVEGHKGVIDDGQHVHSVALTFMNNADQLEKVASGTLPHTVWWANSLDFLTWTRPKENSAFMPTTYATGGPEITQWILDSRDYVANGNYWDWTPSEISEGRSVEEK